MFKHLFMMMSLLFTASYAEAKPRPAPAVEVEKAWVRATVGNLRTTAMYARLVNLTKEDDALVRVSSPYAAMSAVHRTTIDASGYMEMNEVEKVELPVDHYVQMEPGDIHIMLMRVDRKLEPGDEIPVKLEFENSPAITVRAKVYSVKATWADIK